MRRPILVALLGVLTAVLIGSAAFVVVPRWLSPATVEVPPAEAGPDAAATGRIRATLFYVAEDGLHLTAVDADVPYSASPSEQARALVDAQLQPAPPPLARTFGSSGPSWSRSPSAAGRGTGACGG